MDKLLFIGLKNLLILRKIVGSVIFSDIKNRYKYYAYYSDLCDY